MMNPVFNEVECESPGARFVMYYVACKEAVGAERVERPIRV